MTLTTSSHLEPGRCPATHARAGRRRGGFTLIELLVVIAIIAVLAALTGAAIQMTTVRQRNLNTKSDVNKLQQALDVEYSRVVKKCADDRVAGRIPQQIQTYCVDPNRAQAVWTAMNLYRQFPNSFTEAQTTLTVGGYSLPPMATFASVQSLPTGQVGGNDESGVLLYIILSQKSVTGGGAMASDADNLGLQKMVTIGSTSLPAFKDAWGNSIGFHRWDASPTVQAVPFLPSPSPMNANNYDPLDTRNLVLSWTDPTNGPYIRNLLSFNGHNRIPGVYSPGQPNANNPVYGYQAKVYGN